MTRHTNLDYAVNPQQEAPRPYTGANGFYAAVTIRRPELVPLQNLFRNAVGFEMPLNENQDIGLHCTVMYSKQALAVTPDIANAQNARVRDLIMSATVSGFDYWDGHNDKGYFVAKLYSPDLQTRHNAWKSMGAKPTFDPYEAHVTIVEGADSKVLRDRMVDLNRALAVGKTITLRLMAETISDLKK